FIFYRGADRNLLKEEINIDKLQTSKAIHFGSAMALINQPMKDTYINLLMDCAKSSYISFDPNFRKDLWKNNIDQFIELFYQCAQYAHLIKLSKEELETITGISEVQRAVDDLRFRDKIILITLGADG